MMPRKEHPNPGFYREKYINLNGEWDFDFDFGNSGEERKLYENEIKLSKKIIVPFCPESELSGVNYKDFMAAVWYKKTINLTKEQLDTGKAFIVFGAVPASSRTFESSSDGGIVIFETLSVSSSISLFFS